MHGCDANLVTTSLEEGTFRSAVDSLRALRLRTAWVANDRSRHQVPVDPDIALLSACQKWDELQPQVTALPPSTGQDSPQRVLEMVGAGACSVVRLCPSAAGHHYPLTDWMLTPLPETCERECLSLAVDYQDLGSHMPWIDIVAFARAFPKLPMVVLSVDIDQDRTVWGALDMAPNLLVELSQAASVTALEPLVDAFGSHRFLYGSGGNGWDLLDAIAKSPRLREARESIVGGVAHGLVSGEWSNNYL
jgi:hypothetical protein